MRKLFLAACLAGSFISCQQQPGNHTGGNAQLAALFKNYWDRHVQLYPVEATQQGDNRYNNRLPNDQTQAYRDTLKQYYQSYADSLQTFNREKLSDNDKISYDIFKYEMAMQLKALAIGITAGSNVQVSWKIPVQQFWGLPSTMGQAGSGTGFQPFKTVKDYENWLQRLKGFHLWTDSAVANLHKGVATGVVLPKVLVQKTIPQMEAMATATPESNLFYGPVQHFPKDFSAADKQRLTNAYRQAIITEVVPAYKALGEFLKNEYLPKARTSTGVDAIVNGDNIYQYLVSFWTTTNETPEQIYKTGLSEMKRIRGLMDSVKNAVGFKGDLNAFFNYMRTNPRFKPYKTPQQVLAAFEAIHQRIMPNVKKIYGRFPKTAFEIRQTEAFRAASASAEYNPGTPDGSRPGIFYVPILNAAQFNITSGMESLFLHEAIPGHHFQVSLQQEDKSLPAFRRFSWYGAYGEGYALYCESLGKELGLYTDPYQYMGALGDEIHRAIRLVVDVGMHTGAMTREQAIKYMMDNEAIDEQGATAEVERYMAIPGQALSYKIGALKIRELREKYRRQLGGKFKLANFHDELLKDGCMPLSVLESKMDAWAAKQ